MPFSCAAQVASAVRVMEEDTAENYEELAAALDLHGNPEAADVFRGLAQEARERAAGLMEEGAIPPPSGFQWRTIDDVVAEQEALHYMMRPYHALEVAREGRRRALARLAEAAAGASGDALRRVVRAVKDINAQVEELGRRLAEAAPPEDGWDEDPDPPNYDM